MGPSPIFKGYILPYFRSLNQRNLLTYQNTPVQEIHDPLLSRFQIRLFTKREDLNHPFVSGNKWWKLKYNLKAAEQTEHKTLLTFGGAFSNHIYAVAAAAPELALNSIGIIRGEEVLPLNDTLRFARMRGMTLHYISREAYRHKTEERFLDDLRVRYGDFYLLPEGGSNALAVDGVAEFAKTLGTGFDYLCCPVGTGGTLTGLIKGLNGHGRVLGFSALKSGAHLRGEVIRLGAEGANWEINTAYHFGGYARATPALHAFISDFEKNHSIPLDFVYTGKMMFGIFDLVSKGYFEKGSKLMALHTGGIQHRS